MSENINLVWFRNDLRVGDNPALFYAAEQGTVIGIYLEPVEQRVAHSDANCKLGFINDTVNELRKQLNELNIPLHSFKVRDYQQSVEKIEQLAEEFKADGAPYFRIMSPITQSQRFDPEGEFIRKLIPELASLNDKDIHFPNSQQRKELGYPEPIIDYKEARKTALELLS